MLALVIVDTVLVVLMAGLVAGLLRSHTEILRAIDSLDKQMKELRRPLEAQPAASKPMTVTPVVIGKDPE